MSIHQVAVIDQAEVSRRVQEVHIASISPAAAVALGSGGGGGGGGGGGALTGTGSPENVVTATIGTEYIDTTATNGAIKWIKVTGSGNTGWKVLYGDTGWRDIRSLLVNGWVP